MVFGFRVWMRYGGEKGCVGLGDGGCLVVCGL